MMTKAATPKTEGARGPRGFGAHDWIGEVKLVCAHGIVRRVVAVEESDARLRAGRLAFRREDIPGHGTAAGGATNQRAAS